jgi:hypothetical protein
MNNQHPYDLKDLLSGSPRVVVAPITVDVPEDPTDILQTIAPYTLKPGWRNIGAAKESTTLSTDEESEELRIQNETGAVIEEITETNRTLEISIASLNVANLQLIEETSQAEIIAASAAGAPDATKKRSWTRVPVGSYQDHAPMRIAFIARRSRQVATVTEPGGATRGPWVMYAGFRATLAAEERSMEMEQGELTHVPVTLRFFPEPDRPEGEEYADWLIEDPGVIVA